MISQSEPGGHPLDARQPADKVTAPQRERRNGHQGMIVWLTGLSGAGKTTIATELERRLFTAGRQTYLLDGDILRRGLCKDLGFSAEDRRENIRRVGEVAALFADAGCIAIAAFISPIREDREIVRRIVARGRFVEVFVNAPLSICEQRDVKGLYAKARANEIKNFTGISAPYEAPTAAEIELHTDKLSVADSVTKVLDYLRACAQVMDVAV
jgi:adenylyl-sulfate kinase